MIAKNFKIIFTIFFIFFAFQAKSKNIYSNDFNSKDLSNYFSGVISHNNQKNDQALKYFKSSKQLLNKHEEYFKRLIFSLVLNQNVDRAIQEIKFLRNFCVSLVLTPFEHLSIIKFKPLNLAYG